jgi:enamine deaminase RidA (YjgF/YER057c/UK114 family)
VTRRTVRSGGGFEEAAAYSRAVRIGSNVAVSATAAIDGAGVVHRGDTYAQTLEALEKALAAAAELGASKTMTLRTRLLLAVDADWREAARAHRDVFAGINPANATYFVGGLIPDEALVEVELDAVVDEAPR